MDETKSQGRQRERGHGERDDRRRCSTRRRLEIVLRVLGITSSPSFVREPQGNGCAERFIRTLKEQLLWPRRFATIEELWLALQSFRERYNREWLIERDGYQTPSATRTTLVGEPASVAA